MTLPLFDPEPLPPEVLGEGAVLLHGWSEANSAQWIAAVQQVLIQAPWRAVFTPGGERFSVLQSNCGDWGWVSDAHGYRYSAHDPATHQPWPAMAAWLRAQAQAAAAAAGYPGFAPDVCLLNRYTPGAKMGLHRDADEMDWAAPIVSVSLGLPCTFLWGGAARQDAVRRVPLQHGDVLVWGGASRMAYHGVHTLREGHHPQLGSERWNLAFRMARSRYRANI